MADKSWDTITFDCYGTLVDWETGIANAFVETAALDGVQLERAAVLAQYHEVEPEVEAESYRLYRQVLAETARRIADNLAWSLDPIRADFLSRSLPDWPVFDDTPDALERLKSRYKIAILSNTDDDLLSQTLNRIGVEFDWTLTAQQVRSYKPAPAHFEEALRLVGGNRDSLLHAAQSYFHDIRPTGQMGISSVWVNRGGQELPHGPPPLKVVADLAELVNWLEV